MAALLSQQADLIATLPSQLARLQEDNPRVCLHPPPFRIPSFELKMAWSPLLQHNPYHQWIRRLVVEVGRELIRVSADKP